jgi:parallel beta-helix repeat protein
MPTRYAIHCAGIFTAIIAAAAFSGDLNPPLGPVTPTMKSLQDHDPRIPIDTLPGDVLSTHVISTPGNYFLRADITGIASRRGISVQSDRVTIDLNGFRLIGGANSLDGITDEDLPFNEKANLVIRNGFIDGWGGSGIVFVNTSVNITNVVAENNTISGFSMNKSILSGCRAVGNGMFGFSVTMSTMRQCSAFDNTQDGIRASSFSTIADCVARGNTGHGIFLAQESSARSSASSQNDGAGFSLVQACQTSDCTASFNDLSGFLLSNRSIVRGCTAAFNMMHGFEAVNQHPCVIDSCMATGNTLNGVDVQVASTITGTTASSNGGSGIQFAGGCTIRSCTAFDNGAIGFDSESPGSTVRDCSALNNTGAGFESFNCNLYDSIATGNAIGIECAGGIVRNCTVSFNNNQGIHSLGGTRLEHNHAEFNSGAGIEAMMSGQSILISNTATGNAASDFIIPSGNIQGNVIDLSGGGAPLVSGRPRENIVH